jgi:uncharacterized membrane protein
MKNILIAENLIKNFLVVVLALVFFPVITSPIESIEATQMNDFLLTISIFLVSICFANFAFTYEKSNLNNLPEKILSHTAVASFMLLLALSLEVLVIAIRVVYPTLFSVFVFFAILLYFGVVLYDFWDILRSRNR